MFEKRLEEISKKLDTNQKGKFYVISNKPNRREIYFQRGNIPLRFIKNKFNSPFKKIVYVMLTLKLLQPFLKKIELPKKMGQVIYIAEQIKCFDLNSKKVLSFPLDPSKNTYFVKTKKIQQLLANKGFAPIIFKLNRDIPYVEEELLKEYRGGEYLNFFKKLYTFYEFQGIKTINSKEYIMKLTKQLKQNGLKNDYLEQVLDKLGQTNKKLLLTKVHGDFVREHVLLRNKEYIFTDWMPQKRLIISDLCKFFRNEENLISNPDFNTIIKIFPEKVQKEIQIYIILNEIDYISRVGTIHDKPLNRIRNALKKTEKLI